MEIKFTYPKEGIIEQAIVVRSLQIT